MENFEIDQKVVATETVAGCYKRGDVFVVDGCFGKYHSLICDKSGCQIFSKTPENFELCIEESNERTKEQQRGGEVEELRLGQEIVATKDDKRGRYKKGDVLKIKEHNLTNNTFYIHKTGGEFVCSATNLRDFEPYSREQKGEEMKNKETLEVGDIVEIDGKLGICLWETQEDVLFICGENLGSYPITVDYTKLRIENLTEEQTETLKQLTERVLGLNYESYEETQVAIVRLEGRLEKQRNEIENLEHTKKLLENHVKNLESQKPKFVAGDVVMNGGYLGIVTQVVSGRVGVEEEGGGWVSCSDQNWDLVDLSELTNDELNRVFVMCESVIEEYKGRIPYNPPGTVSRSIAIIEETKNIVLEHIESRKTKFVAGDVVEMLNPFEVFPNGEISNGKYVANDKNGKYYEFFIDGMKYIGHKFEVLSESSSMGDDYIRVREIGSGISGHLPISIAHKV